MPVNDIWVPGLPRSADSFRLAAAAGEELRSVRGVKNRNNIKMVIRTNLKRLTVKS
jgi:hypothetical protein